MRLPFSRVLLLSNLGVDLGDPRYRVGSYTTYLLPMASALVRAGVTDVRVIANEVVAAALTDSEKIPANLSPAHLWTLDMHELRASGADEFMVDSYRGELDCPRQSLAAATLDRTLRGWRPDVILCWEAPTKPLRKLFPDALVIDIMPGMFMRPPYPRMLSFDPEGLYKDAWYSRADPRLVSASDRALEDLHRLRATYLAHHELLAPKAALLPELQAEEVASCTLVPLQISGYFGWRDNCAFASQFELIRQVLAHRPLPRKNIFTQYTGSLVSEQPISDANESYLKASYPSFVYSAAFAKLDSISQHLVPDVGEVISISSTLGLQAKFFQKRLVSPSWSHLSHIADATELSTKTEANLSLDPFLAHALTRTNFLFPKLINEAGYLASILASFVERKNEAPQELFPSESEVGNTAETILGASPISRSQERFRKAFGAVKTASGRTTVRNAECILDPSVEHISFDVFDTLLCRVVGKSTDVFLLMQARLQEENRYPARFVEGFPRLREGVEWMLRRQLDKDPASLPEEMSIRQVYAEILRIAGLDLVHVETLVLLEQEIELRCLKSRPAGRDLYLQALRSGKPITLISDFIHPTEFVERALRLNGYQRWDHIFVSSDCGTKKHSGRLYDRVLSELGVPQPAAVAHFGDNPHGDIERAREKGIRSNHVPPAGTLLRRANAARAFNLNGVRKSLVMSAVLHSHANENLGAGGSRQPSSTEMDLISNAYEFGYVVLGPMLHFFSQWIMAEAREQSCEQVVFFSRDCRVPFEISRAMATENGCTTSVRYMHLSRAAVCGLNVFSPDDLLETRIDDFVSSEPLADLLETRFGLRRGEIALAEIESWTDKPLEEVTVGDLPNLAIHKVAQRSAELHWESYSARLEERRATFSQALIEWGVDVDKRTVCVDFGYKGTIFNAVAHFFKAEAVPRFFSSYASARGSTPVPQLRAFLLENVLASDNRWNPVLEFNLVLETLVNEGRGSVVGYRRTAEGIEVLRDAAVDAAHARTIHSMHEGAKAFSAYWRTHCSIIDRYARPEQGVLTAVFSEVMRAPTAAEAQILSDLTFDNGFAGQRARAIAAQDSHSGAIWTQGAKALSHGSQSQAGARSGKNGRGANGGLNGKSVNGASRTQHGRLPFLVDESTRAALRLLRKEKLLRKFERNPTAFFEDSRHLPVKALGRLFYS